MTCVHDDYDACMYSALEDHMMKNYGCVAPFILSKETICKEFDKVVGTYKIAWNRLTNQARTAIN